MCYWAALCFFIFSVLLTACGERVKFFVPVDVNEVAAESQKAAALSEHENLEPGSNLWIARQAYLKLMEKTFQSEKPEDLRLIQARYKLLQQTIIDEQEKEEQKEKKNNIPLLNQKAEQDQDSSAVVISSPTDFLQGNTPDNQALMGKYLAFLETYPVALPVNEDEKDETNKDLVELKRIKMMVLNLKIPHSLMRLWCSVEG